MKRVLFTSVRPLDRAENIKAVFDAYEGDKVFERSSPYIPRRFERSDFDLVVSDDYIDSSPGKSIHIGHGISGGKLYGLDQPHPYHTQDRARLITWYIVTSPSMVPIGAQQAGIPEERVLPLGMPRTDQYMGKKKGDGGTVMAGKRAYLYAPTFRSGGDPSYPDIDWESIDYALDDGEILIVKPHMVTKTILKRNYKHIVEISADEPSAPYLIDCDALITDYSSIMFDAHVLGKPVILFEKNLGYIHSRGMYLPYPSCYSSRYCRTENELIMMLKEADGQREADLLCKELTASACDGHSTERVVDLIRRTL